LLALSLPALSDPDTMPLAWQVYREKCRSVDAIDTFAFQLFPAAKIGIFSN